MSKKQSNWSLSSNTRAPQSARTQLVADGLPTGDMVKAARSRSVVVSAGESSVGGKTFIGSDCGIKGQLLLREVSELNCRVEGDIISEQELVIGESAEIAGNIRAETLRVFGSVRGDVFCSEKLELHSGAKVIGTITSPRVVMHDGVRFEGECHMPVAEESEHYVSLTEDEEKLANE